MGGGNLLFIIMFTLPFVAIAGIVMLARNWSTPVEHPEPSGWATVSKANTKRKPADPLYGPEPGKSGRKPADSAEPPAAPPGMSGVNGHGTRDGLGSSTTNTGTTGTNGAGTTSNGEFHSRPAIPPQTPAYLDDGDGWLPMDDPANADTGPNPRHRLN